MIELEFKIDQEQISPKYLKLFKTTNKSAIQINCFVMPVRFKINGEDFFYYKGYPIGPWFAQPLIDLVTVLYSYIKNLSQNKKVTYSLNELSAEIKMEMKSKNTVKLALTQHDKVFVVDYNELVNAFEKFEKKIKKFLNENALPLNEHPYWGPWLRGEVEWDNDKGLIPIKTPKKH